MTIKCGWMIRSAALLGLLVPTQAWAEDMSDLEGLLTEQVVSSASKQPERANFAPALSTNLTAEDLRRYGIKTIAEAVDFLSLGVAASENLNGGEIGARGVLITGDRGSHFLLLVDGHTVNEQVRGSAWFGVGAGIPLDMVDHIEIIVGPGSVLYGSNAMLGLINVVTKRAKDYSGLKIVAESTMPLDLRLTVGGGRQFTLFGKEGEVTTNLEYYKQKGPNFFFGAENTGVDIFTGQPGRYDRSNTGTGIWGGRAATRSLYADAPSGLVRIGLGNTQLELRGSYYRHASPTGPGDFDDPGTGEKEKRASFDLKHQFALSTLVTLAARVYGDYFTLEKSLITSRGQLCPYTDAAGATLLVTCNYLDTSSAKWFGTELQSTWDWMGTGQFVSVAGVEVRERFIETSSHGYNILTGQDAYMPRPGLNERDTTVGAYFQQTWNATEKLHFSGGARIDHDPRFPVQLTPRLAMTWTPWKGGTLKSAYAEAFRAPSWDETSSSTSSRIVADSLANEKVRSIEASAQQQIGPHRLLVGAFYTRWTNLVELHALSDAEVIQAIRDGKTPPIAPGAQLQQYRNAAEIHNYGINTGVDGSIGVDRFQYGLTLTAAVAERVENGMSQRLSVAPQIFGNARLSFVPGGNLPTASLAAHFSGRREGDHATDGGFVPTPYAPAQAEMRLCLSGSVPHVPGLTYRALANVALSDRGPYVVGPVTTALPTQMSAQLNPVDRFRTTVGLRYEF